MASAAARVAAIEASLPPMRAALAAARASAGGADRRSGRASWRSTWRRAPIRRWPRRCRSASRRRCCGGGPTCAPPNGGWRRRRRARASPRPISSRGSPSPASSGCSPGAAACSARADSRAWAVTPALSWAAFDLGSARARLRGAEAATRESLAGLRADGAAGARGGRERAGRLSRAAAAAGGAGRPGARERARRGDRARALPRRASPTSCRCSTPSARSCRRRKRSRRPRPASSPASWHLQVARGDSAVSGYRRSPVQAPQLASRRRGAFSGKPGDSRAGELLQEGRRIRRKPIVFCLLNSWTSCNRERRELLPSRQLIRAR